MIRISATKKLFRAIPDDAAYPDQWFIDDPLTADGREVDPDYLVEGSRYEGPVPTVASIGNPGRELAFSFGCFDLPVVTDAVANIIRQIAPRDVQCFPIDIPGASGTYQILNAIHSLECLDEVRSEFTLSKPGHPPDLAGKYHSIAKIRIDPDRTRDHHIFRLHNWEVVLLVSGTIKDALADIPHLGVLFDPV